MPSHKLINSVYGEDRIIITWCDTMEYQFSFAYYPDGKDLGDIYSFDLEVHIKPRCGFFRRLWPAIRYMFGHKTRFGDFSGSLIHDRDAREIVKFFGKHLEELCVLRKQNGL